MGSSTSLTLQEAAALLGVSAAAVRRLSRTGCLHPKFERIHRNHEPRYDQRELEAYAAAKPAPWDARKRALVGVQTQAGLRQLERRVQYLENALGARLDPPSLAEEAVVSAYATAIDEVAATPCDEESVLRWSRFFLGVGEEYFDVLEAVTGDEDGWKVFLELSVRLAKAAPYAEFDEDQALRLAYGYLEAGRKNLRNVLFFHVHSREGFAAARKQVGGPVDVHDDILSIVASGM